MESIGWQERFGWGLYEDCWMMKEQQAGSTWVAEQPRGMVGYGEMPYQQTTAKRNGGVLRDASPADCSLAVFEKKCGHQRRMSPQGPPEMHGVTMRHRRNSIFFLTCWAAIWSLTLHVILAQYVSIYFSLLEQSYRTKSQTWPVCLQQNSVSKRRCI